MNWDIIIQNILVSAVVAVVFSGGTNYFLQKRNNRAKILYEKGYELVDKIYSLNDKRIETSTYVTFFHDIPDDDMKQIYSDYVRELNEFEKEVKKRTIFFNKKINNKLDEFISYSREVEIAIEKNLKGENYSINFNKKVDELCEQIIKMIKNA